MLPSYQETESKNDNLEMASKLNTPGKTGQENLHLWKIAGRLKEPDHEVAIGLKLAKKQL